MPRGTGSNWRYDEAELQRRLLDLRELRPRLWLDASDASTIGLATGVSEWRDKSGNNRHVFQATTSRQPAYIRNNGLLRFNSASLQRLESIATIETGNNYSILCVVKDNNVSATISEPFSIGNPSVSVATMEFVLDFTNGGVTSGAFSAYGSTVFAFINATSTKSALQVNSIGLANGVGRARSSGRDGTSLSPTGVSTATAAFGVGYSRPQGIYFLNGDIGEILVIPFPIGSREFIAAEGSLAWKSGVQLNASSPFANRPPLIGD